jgi:hypothetical protein
VQHRCHRRIRRRGRDDHRRQRDRHGQSCATAYLHVISPGPSLADSADRVESNHLTGRGNTSRGCRTVCQC